MKILEVLLCAFLLFLNAHAAHAAPQPGDIVIFHDAITCIEKDNINKLADAYERRWEDGILLLDELETPEKGTTNKRPCYAGATAQVLIMRELRTFFFSCPDGMCAGILYAVRDMHFGITVYVLYKVFIPMETGQEA
ncbi:MAG TPA: hypothetical protein VD928_00520 [Candidatus Paceibacterota bacterium]|nr:hypothetical protein [Candidatus Paceibacterota bacterium]